MAKAAGQAGDETPTRARREAEARKRSPSPGTVSADRIMIAVALVVVSVALYGYEAYSHRVHRDWSDLSNLDSIAWQTIEGIIMSHKADTGMPAMLTRISESKAAAGRHYLVTGGNRGLGRAITRRLLCLGATVTITSRSTPHDLAESIAFEAAGIEQCSLPDPKLLAARLRVQALDLSNLQSVKAAVAAQSDARHGQAFDAVILNAGLAPLGKRLTAQGFEEGLGVNCVGHYVLTKLLVEHGLLAAGGRLVVVTSETHRASPPLDLEHLFDPVTYAYGESMTYYARSKLAVNTVATYWTETLRGQVSVHSICPGPVATDIARHAPAGLKILVDAFMKAIFQTPDEAALPVVMLAVDENYAERTGDYFHMYKPKAQRADVVDVERARRFIQRLEDILDQK